jgi:hypothetical protein
MLGGEGRRRITEAHCEHERGISILSLSLAVLSILHTQVPTTASPRRTFRLVTIDLKKQLDILRIHINMGDASLPSSLAKSIDETKVSYAQLGKSGLRVSIPILGAMSFGHKDW